MIVFGPVPSRRLGRSLGINNIPPKACSYSCVYCQVGPTNRRETEPHSFYTPDEILSDVKSRVEAADRAGEEIDYLTFVPDGEPTLDSQLKESIENLRSLDIPIAIISNASLIWREDVRRTLSMADWVSLKVDAISESLWRRINRPDISLDHQAILDGMLSFASEFKGTLATESMFVKGMNDTEKVANEIGGFLRKLKPEVAYLSIPTRPPSEESVSVPDESTLNRIFQIISKQVTRVELMTGYEGNAFSSTGNVIEDLLSITAVHPMREEAVQVLLNKTGTNWNLVEQLIKEHKLLQTEHEGRKFYVRCLRQKVED